MKFAFPLIPIFLIPAMAGAHSTYTGYSGAPGSNGTCTNSCHGQYSFTPTVTVTGFPENFEPGHRYRIAVGHAGGSAINQFNASVRIGDGSENGGLLEAGDNTEVYDTQNETNGVRWSSTDTDSGTFIWTAPAAGTGEVRFYWAGLQGTRSNGTDTQVVKIAIDPTSAVEYHPGAPGVFSMGQNYPNPFNDRTIVEISVAEAGQVDFIITNILGQMVYEWRRNIVEPGNIVIRWDGRKFDGSDLPSGVYFYRMTTRDGIITRKMMLLR